MSAFDIRYENWWFFDKIFDKKLLESRQSEKRKNKKLMYFWARKI